MSEENAPKRHLSLLKQQRIKELKAMKPDDLLLHTYDLESVNEELRTMLQKQELANDKLKKRIDELINEKNPTYKYAGYDKSKDGIDKIVFILEKNKPSMTFANIVNTMLTLEPELKERWSNVNKSITNLLSKACKYGAIVRLRKWGNRGDYVYRIAPDQVSFD